MSELNLSELSTNFVHVPVLSRELITGLSVVAGGHYLDATVGGGGHSLLILQAAADVHLTALDQDEVAIAVTQARLAEIEPSFVERVKFWRGNFAEYQPKGMEFDGIIADLGVNSYQLDTPTRGFSFRHSAPLDMRMNQQQSLSAADIINTWDEVELADIFFDYGEERLSRRIARKIVQQRPFETTTQLADVIASCYPPKSRYGRIHPATRVFQALRIAVNQELTALETFLSKAPQWLKLGCRIGVISFHSLEDRRVKQSFKSDSHLQVLTKKPIQPLADEIADNPRARSAKLRLAERITI
ncbi:16S rRNA (cytosine(1402)-N(4))-methyltransferase RsmH [Limnoraphis robusta]|uniref:Ribosomal RNA small subunit methyltransferase H n=1 Tax=Limnoraphis robusta CCNP1315 TaxID=3110306 RepID=A0ABU5TWS6_9CYAN|nr:16S rRNA (cytosine(1402)-N(4))-methyltransferase RsmH [Limnoraphis robusta]MEA5519250.1 16S rRNA (cytosine(1402)-N(4))-methyltransferase RsmH [Limnoraphis robusta CCNP1315]MEA5547119.1 16S rRNA (cytosine(1402)-N(4))-methyltransferase RsmH [Limnoraphis robusta CCNP1324]